MRAAGRKSSSGRGVSLRGGERAAQSVTTALAPIRALRHRTRLARERAVLPTDILASDYSVPMGLPVHPHQQAELGPQAARPGPALRAIAGFEALKGIVALAAGLGFLSLLHQDLHRVAASLIGHIGLDPGGHYPTIILNNVDKLLAVNRGALLLAALAYVLVRFVEAYGLWNERPWGEWLGALSGALYVPFELRHLIHSPTLATAAVVVVNIAVVGFLAWQLRQRGLSRAARGAHP